MASLPQRVISTYRHVLSRRESSSLLGVVDGVELRDWSSKGRTRILKMVSVLL